MPKRQRDQQDTYTSKAQKLHQGEKLYKPMEQKFEMEDDAEIEDYSPSAPPMRLVRKVRRDNDPWFDNLVQEIESKYPVNVDEDGDTEMGRRKVTKRKSGKKLSAAELHNIRLKNLAKARAAKARKATQKKKRYVAKRK